MKHDAGGGAGLILRDSAQLRAEIIHLNQAELHQRNQFDVEAGADGGGEGCIGAECERAGDGVTAAQTFLGLCVSIAAPNKACTKGETLVGRETCGPTRKVC